MFAIGYAAVMKFDRSRFVIFSLPIYFKKTAQLVICDKPIGMLIVFFAFVSLNRFICVCLLFKKKYYTLLALVLSTSFEHES